MDWAAFTVVCIVVALGWLVRAIAFPWVACPNCDGTAKFRDGKAWRFCRRCGGTGRRVRLTRRIVGLLIRRLRL